MAITVDLPHLVNDKDIMRGKIFRAAFPFSDGRPLKFLRQCPHAENCNHRAEGQACCGKVVPDPYGFDSDQDEELLVVTPFKARYVVVLSTSVLNHNIAWKGVVVAPIMGIHDDELDQIRIRKIMVHDPKYFTAYYLEPSITGMHCYINLSRISQIPKNWLFQEKGILTDTRVFDDISRQIGLILAQKSLAECDRCQRPCESCAFKNEVEMLRRQLGERNENMS